MRLDIIMCVCVSSCVVCLFSCAFCSCVSVCLCVCVGLYVCLSIFLFTSFICLSLSVFIPLSFEHTYMHARTLTQRASVSWRMGVIPYLWEDPLTNLILSACGYYEISLGGCLTYHILFAGCLVSCLKH